MTVHYLDLYVSKYQPDGSSPVDTAAKKQQLQSFRDNHQEVLTAQSVDFGAGNTAEDGTGVDFYSGSFRFAWAEDVTALKDTLFTWVQNNFAWGAVRYHQCDHDQSDRQGCSWNRRWQHPDTPQELRDMLNLAEIPEGTY